MEEKQEDLELLPRRNSQVQKPHPDAEGTLEQTSRVLTGAFKSQSVLPKQLDGMEELGCTLGFSFFFLSGL